MSAPAPTMTPLGRLKPLLDACVHCGFCLPTCPSYVVLATEMDSPRGRIHVLKAGAEGRLDLTGSVIAHYDTCLGCMACVTACPSGVRYGPMLEAVRGRIEESGRRGVFDRTLRGALLAVLANPRRLRALTVVSLPFARLLKKVARSGVGRALPSPIRAALALQPDVRLADMTVGPPERTPAAGAVRLRVALLTGCVQRVFFSRVNQATARVLAAEGCEVMAPPDQECCGALAVHVGHEEEARRSARRLIASMERAGADLIVVNAAGCGSAMKEYGALFEGDPQWAGRARQFAAKVRDVSEVLDTLVPRRATRHPLPMRVAYQDACHLRHAQGITREPRRQLAEIPGVEVVAIDEADICCGSAGIYNLVQPALASALGARKAKAVADARVEAVVSTNPGCMLQIASATGMPVWHLAEVIDASIAGDVGRLLRKSADPVAPHRRAP